MNKKFKFYVGTPVWFMYNNQPTEGVITKLWYTEYLSPVNNETIEKGEKYSVSVDGNFIGEYKPRFLFRTKDELLKTL